MPRYFFEVECGEAAVQRVVSEQPSLDSAKQYALGMIDVLMHGQDAEPWRITIKGDAGEAVSVMASDAVRGN